MKELIKPKGTENGFKALLDAMCSENDCNCTSTDPKHSYNGTNNGSTQLPEDEIFF